MRQIIIYKSKTGFTKRYASWLSEALQCEAVPFEEAGQIQFSDYDVIIFGSSIRGGVIEELKWYRETILPLEKVNVVFVTGAMPPASPENTKAITQNFNRKERKTIRIFYLQSGLNYEEMSFGEKLMMKMFRKMLKSRKNRTEEERSFTELIQKSFDCTEKANMEPMLNYLQGL